MAYQEKRVPDSFLTVFTDTLTPAINKLGNFINNKFTQAHEFKIFMKVNETFPFECEQDCGHHDTPIGMMKPERTLNRVFQIELYHRDR